MKPKRVAPSPVRDVRPPPRAEVREVAVKRKSGAAAEQKIETTLSVTARVLDSKLMLRMAGAEATTEDGRRVEVSAGVDGASVLVTVYPPKPKTGWRTYAITADAFVRAVPAAEDIKPC